MSVEQDPLAIVAEYKREQAQKSATKAVDLAKLETGTKLLRNIVYENANPSPVLVAIIIAGVMLASWFVYVTTMKPNASGLWVDDLGNTWRLCHGTFGELSTTYNGVSVPSSMSDNMFKSGNLLGIWNYANVIILVSGGNLTRIVR